MNTLREKLKACIEQERSLVLVESHLLKLSDRLEERKKDLALMDQVVAKEHEDIIALERLSMRQLFHQVLGADMEQRLAKEREEFLLAVLKRKDILKSIELMEFEHKILQEKLDALPQIKSTLAHLLSARKEEILFKGGKSKDQILNLNRKIDDLTRIKREIYEAKIAGAKVKQSVLIVLKYLEQAIIGKEWNPNNYKKGINKDSVQKAQDEFYKLKQFLLRFNDELMDIDQHRNQNFLKDFVDVVDLAKRYHQKLIADWYLAQQIFQSKEEMNRLLQRTEMTMIALTDEDKNIDQTILGMEGQQKDIIINDIN